MTVEITTVAELEGVLGTAGPVAANKGRHSLHALDVQWIAHSSMIFMATSAADGTCDVSPKGDPAGFVRVLDAHTLAIPERPGNRRADGFHNVLANPHVGLIFLVPGRTDTFRVNGRARLVREAPYFDAMAVRGRPPALAMEVTVEEIFYHCAKAFLRSRLWEHENWAPDVLPTRAQIVHALERTAEPLAAVERHYGPPYADTLY
ncbi:MAG TPA: pyridoxamine 5'-phosphate oxidase family protein [Pseudonocardia sp.]